MVKLSFTENSVTNFVYDQLNQTYQTKGKLLWFLASISKRSISTYGRTAMARRQTYLALEANCAPPGAPSIGDCTNCRPLAAGREIGKPVREATV